MIIINKKSLFCFLFLYFFIFLHSLYSFPIKLKNIFIKQNKTFSYINSLIVNNKLEEAESFLFSLLKKNYNQKLCFLMLGNLYIKNENYYLARENYQKALEKFKQKDIKIFLYKQIINTFDSYENLYEIIKILNEAYINKCFDLELLVLTSFFYEKLSIKEKSIAFLKEAYSMEDNNFDVNLNLIDFYNKNLDYDNAIFHFNQIKQLHPKFYNKNVDLAEIYFKKNEIKKSYNLCQEISEKVINYKLFELLGNIFYLEKKYDKAIEMYKKSFMLINNNFDLNQKTKNSTGFKSKKTEFNEFNEKENLLINLYILAKKTKNSLLLKNVLKEIKKGKTEVLKTINSLDSIVKNF